MLKNKTLLITGGTGSFGSAVLDKFIRTNHFNEIRIFSRDEKKQDDMRNLYKSDILKFYIGDVRDYNSVDKAMRGVHYVFHAAALKQVPSCEFFPIEATKTNVLGTQNVIDAAEYNKVEKVICLSTDKAVYPINAMGTSKAMMEKVVLAKSRSCPEGTKVCLTRYGNVMASRGSVIPLFDKQIKSNKPLTVTNSEMTRFMMTLDDAVELVIHTFVNGHNGDIFVQKSPAATIKTLVRAMLELRQKDDNYPIKEIGIRHGEKQYEALCSREEMLVAEDEENYFRIPVDKRDLNYEKFFEVGSTKKISLQEYSSDNTHRLNVDEMKSLLLKLEIFNEE